MSWTGEVAVSEEVRFIFIFEIFVVYLHKETDQSEQGFRRMGGAYLVSEAVIVPAGALPARV